MDLEAAQGVLDAQPFNGVVGARRTSFGAGEAVLDHHRQQYAGTVGEVVARLYEAFAAADGVALANLLHPQFVGRVSAGMPFDAGGAVDGPEQMLRDVWGATFTQYDTAPQPDDVVIVGGDRAIVFGYYRGCSRTTNRRYEAAFAHDITVRDGRIATLIQVTDTKPWHDALV